MPLLCVYTLSDYRSRSKDISIQRIFSDFQKYYMQAESNRYDTYDV
jgi:hypothetical protein